MGRAERRQRERETRIQERKDRIVLSQDEIRQMKRDIADKIVKFDVDTLFTCFAQALHTEYGWGYRRIFRVLHSVDEMFGKVLNNTLSVADMQERLEREVGIRIKSD